MNLINNIIKVKKRTVLFIGGLVWAFAGSRVFSIGKESILQGKGNDIIAIAVGVIAFALFFKFIFSKLVNKHTKRIVKSALEKHCAFSFFDVKSYIIMAIMITLGISVRSFGIFNPLYLGAFYIGLGIALAMAGVLFLVNSINFKNVKIKILA
ncbi:MAG: hypothetical protein ACRDD2_02185 [Sarcina sp.]